ncbi:Site-specific recombinase XerD [Archaeoglobus sulfaticallidus PM70-1]|uniref:Site-specific recombinase XerD n=1 Tax=Archaeoglobus sulfaticallidus PM70-1 TaxID=387631 RepID=N0BCQ9_9EURY|nr:tyrosine-type recombinase/integrase [Archaeoglobus sulfaticallidus]AGK61399.1 Site-specific recombinase XerD [Archaeoglobus sulfaticallidus PM70-1]
MDLEQFEEVEKWLNNVKGGSKPTYRAGLTLFCQWCGLNPAQLLDEAEEDRKKSRRERGKPEARLMEFYNYLINEKKVAKKTATLYFTAVRSFYKWNGFPLNVKTPKAAPKKENRKAVITPEIVKKLVDHASTLRDRAIILFLFQGGFDVSTLCSLNYGDVKNELEAEKIPMMIHVVREKEEVEYFTFVGRDAVEVLKAYLNDRRAKGEELKYDTPLFIKDKAKRRKGERISPHHIQNMLRETAIKAGLITKEEMDKVDFNPYRPHALRAAFSSILRLNGFDPVLVDFMMGHSIPYNGAYLIPPPEKVRQMYAEVEAQLSISTAVKDVSEIEEKLNTYKKILEDVQAENKRLREQFNALWEEVRIMNELFAQIVENPEMLSTLKEMYGIVKEMEKNPMLRMKLMELKESLQ